VTVSNELSKYKIDMVGVQEVKWDSGGTNPAEYTFFYGKRNETKLNSVALVSERTILTERPPLVSEVSANFRG
jgi:hypothetical protein